MKKTTKSTKVAKKTVKKKKVSKRIIIKKRKSYYKKKVKPVQVVEETTTPQPAAPTPAPIPTSLMALKKATSTKTTGNYLSKKELLFSVMESKGMGKMSNSLAFKLQLLTSKYARSAQFARYTFRDDMEAYAMMMLVRTWNSFNPLKSDNPFAFFTQCIKNSFIQYLNQEKRQRTIRDEMLVDQGLTPSYTYQVEYDAELRHQLEEERQNNERYVKETQQEMDESTPIEHP